MLDGENIKTSHLIRRQGPGLEVEGDRKFLIMVSCQSAPFIVILILILSLPFVVLSSLYVENQKTSYH